MPPEHERLRVARIENAVLPMAKAALDAGQWETARRLYARLLEIDPGSVDARMGLGDVALAKHAPSQAANWYLAAVGHAGSLEARHVALLAHARAALAAGDLESARRSFDHLVDPAENASNSNAAWGFNGIGIVNLLEGDLHEAVASLELAVLRLPNEERFHGNLARSLKLASNYRPADSVSTAMATTPEETGVEPPGRNAETASTGGQQSWPATPVPLMEQSVAEQVVASPSTEDAEPVPDFGSSGSGGETAEAPATEAPEPIEPPEVPADVESPVTPTVESNLPLDAVASAAPLGGEATDPVPALADPKETRQGQQAPGATAQVAGERAANPAASQTAQAQDTKPPPAFPSAFPGAFLVRLETGEFLQVGAFARRQNAERSKSRLLEAVRLPVRIDSNDSPGDPIYRVRIGPIPSAEILSALAVDLGVDATRLAIPRVRDDDYPPPADPATAIVSKRPEPLPDRSTEAPIRVVEDGVGFLQVGAYANHDAAVALVSKLRRLTHHPVTLSEVARGSEPTLYRVRIGPVDADVQPAVLRQIAAR